MIRRALALAALLAVGLPALPCAADGARYLIITPDEFVEDIEPLAEWKTRKGMLARVVPTSEAGYTSVEIRQYVIEAVTTWAPAPEYLLLVGSMSELPMPWVEDGYSDTYFASVDGDHFIELHPGRFPADSADEVETMVAKTLLYERFPSLDDPDYYTSAALLLYEDWDDDDWLHYYGDVNWETGLMREAGFTAVHNITYGTTPNAASVFEGHLEDGLAYAGHHGVVGGFTGCDWPGYSVDPTWVDNGPMLPVIVSYSCQTMSYSPDWACGGELWMRSGNPGDPRGAVAFVGQSVSCAYCAHWRSALRRGFWGYIFEDTSDTEVCTFGAAVEAGRLHYYDEFHLSSQYHASNLYGDPELNLWTGVPREWTLSHPPTVPQGPVDITVSAALAGEPLPGVVVCISGDHGTYAVGTTDAAGQLTLTPDTSADEVLYVTATGRNLLPYEAEVTVAGAMAAGDDDDTTAGDDDDPPSDDDDTITTEPDDTVNIGSGHCECRSGPSAPIDPLTPLSLLVLWIARHTSRRRGSP